MIQQRLHLLLLFCAAAARASKFLHAVPEDPFAFPKYRVSFLNGLPVLNETAENWLQNGLKGGEAEFLDQPWHDAHPPKRKEIGNGDDEPGDTSVPPPASYRLEQMKLGNKMSFLCLVPPPAEPSAYTPSEEELEAEAQVDPLYSWSLLAPLEGRCLYHRQGWFTYSYCHGHRVRQFREAPHAHPHPPGGYTPEEDPEWDAYTLGEAPPTPAPGAELTPTQARAAGANLELAHSTGARYLVQRWGGGTMCDKTGRAREIEVQFHCSPTATDTILLVKEVRTCAYVLVVTTPRLCGVPGFRARGADAGALEQVRCREVVRTLAGADPTLPATDYPLRLPPRPQPSLPPPAKEQPPLPGAGGKPGVPDEAVKKALALLFGGGEVGADRVVVQQGRNGELLIELVDEEGAYDGAEGYGYPQGADAGAGPDQAGTGRDALLKILKNAGFDVEGYGAPPGEKERKRKQQQQEQEKLSHDEMEEDEDDIPILRDEL